MALVVQKFGGTSVADADRIRAVADHVARTRRSGERRGGRGQRHGQDHRRPAQAGGRRELGPADPRGRHAAERRGAHLHVPAVHGPGRAGGRGHVLHRQPGRHHHRHGPHPGQDRRGPGGPAAGHPRRRGRPGGGRLPGGVGRARRDHARAGRLGHHRGGPGRRARCRRVRDLHRRPRRVQRRSPHRARRASKLPRVSFEEMLEIAATGGRVLGPALGGVRPQPPRAAARTFELHLGARAPGSTRRIRPWSRQSSPPSPTTSPRPRSPSPGCPTAPGWRPRCSGAWPTGT